MPIVKLKNLNIHYQERGSGRDHLLLLMGLGAPGDLWEKHVQCLEQKFHCIIVDNRGAGKSDAPKGNYTTKMMADETIELLDFLHIEKIKVAGISMGSAIAQELAIHNPNRVKSLLLISSWSRSTPFLKELVTHFAEVRRQVSPVLFTKLLQLWIYGPLFFKTSRDVLLEARHEAQVNPGMKQDAYESQCHACITHDTFARLPQIKAPCLLTVGSEDIFTPPSASLEMLEQLPNAKLELFEDSGHCHHWEDLERFNAIALEFLGENLK